MSHVSALTLTHYRCYTQQALRDLPRGAVVLYGANGAGKTNVLEAVSLLSPGRGLRGARPPEIQQNGAGAPSQSWAVAAKVETPYGEVQIGTGLDAARQNKRLIRINGATAKSQGALAEYLSCVWLTPQMDRLFLDGTSARRQFLDRLIFAFDASHTGRLTRYENAMRQRSKILKEYERPDPSWLEGLEATMAETGVAIAAARLDFTERLRAACHEADRTISDYFPLARIALSGTLEELLAHQPALEVEDSFRYQLAETRAQDAVTGGAATGPHKTDLIVHYARKAMPADQCSTGEQKALLIGLVLAHARLIKAERGAPPILLLDEIAAHLDDSRRAALYDLLETMGGQVWMTGTDRALFRAIEHKAHILEVCKSEITRAAAAASPTEKISA